MSVPSNRMEPAVGSIRRRISRPTVVLPQPDSPTRPRLSPRLILRSTPSTAFTCGHRALEDAALDREVLDQAADLDERLVVHRRGSMARTVAPMSATVTALLLRCCLSRLGRASGGRQSGVSSDVW